VVVTTSIQSQKSIGSDIHKQETNTGSNVNMDIDMLLSTSKPWGISGDEIGKYSKDTELDQITRILYMSSEKIDAMRDDSSLQTEHRYLMIRRVHEAALKRREALIAQIDHENQRCANHQITDLMDMDQNLPSWNEYMISDQINKNNNLDQGMILVSMREIEGKKDCETYKSSGALGGIFSLFSRKKSIGRK
jgi:hypothetical protein